MNMRRFLAALLAVVMLIAMVPAKAQAAEDDTVYESGKLYLDKTATLEDDGTYTIRMEAFATGTPVTTTTITGKPLDVVLVIDQSGSMYNYKYLDDLEKALDTFIAQLVDNGHTIGKTHRVAVAGFACAAWEMTVTHSIGQLTSPWVATLPTSNGSYGSLWTNTGIYLNDGTFKNFQQFQFEEVAQSALPSYNRNTDNFHVTLGEYDHPVLTDSQNLPRLFPKYFVDDTTTWTYTDENGVEQPQTVRRGIYQHSDGKWYYDFRNYDNNNSDFPRVLVNGTGVLGADQKVYTIDYDSIYTGSEDLSQMFTGGFLTEEDYQKTFMNVTDGAHGAGNVSKAINSIIDNLGASGATRTGIGMEMAYNILVNNPLTEEDKAEGRERVVIVFTDGVPGQSPFEIDEANKALEYGAMIKDMIGTEESVDIYTIGLHGATIDTDAVQDSNVVEPYDQTAQFMNGLSSNYPDADNMEDVWETVTNYSYKEVSRLDMDAYADDQWSTVSGYYAKVGDVYKEFQARRTGSLFGGYTWEFRTVGSSTADLKDFSVTYEYGWGGGYYLNNTVYSYTSTETSGYSPSGTPAVDGGKFYKEANNAADLEHMFPTIVTESTSTSMDSVYLTEGSILRDIMSDALRMTGPVSIWTATQTGTWTSTNDAQTQGKIAWGAETLTGDRRDIPNPSQVKGADNDGQNIQLYNTNPAADGNFYQTASGEPNLTAPPTVDVTGFDYQEEFVAFNKTGRKLIVYISGIEAQPDKVGYGANNLTNHQQSGLWSPMKEDRTRELVGNFPMPNTTFTEALYVLDYAKPMNIPLSDLKMFKADSLDEDAMNYFNPAVPEITEANGKVVLENGKLVYKPMTTAWDGYDTFYVFGESELSTITDYSSNRNGNLWGRVNVLPANNVYYEDTFIQSQNGVTVGIVYSGDSSWTTTGTESGNKELPESGETNYGESPVYNEDMPFGGVHGWEDYLQDDHGYSDGSATTSNAAGATATFTFTGTGVDIYSYTDMKQGAVMASIYAGNAATGKALYSVIMDNFSLSDEYFQIPTLSLHEKYVRDAAGKNVKDENGNNVLEELGFGTYTVKLTVVPKTDDADGDGIKTTRYTYTLDGIRIYNPIQNLEGDETVQKAYGEEELNASFVEVRDILLDQTSIDANNGMLGGVVFLDQVPHSDPNYGSEDDQTGLPSDNYDDTVGVYTCYGPKNEVYLASGQSIAFIPKEGMHYYVGLKSPTGETVCVSIMKDGVAQLLKLDHTTDLYYEITPEEGIVLIGNLGMETRKDENGEIVKDENGEDVYDIYDNLLSVTKIKVTGPDGNEVETADFFEPVDQPTVLRMVRTLREEAAAEPEIPEDTEPTEPTGPEVDIENPTEPSEPEVPDEGGNDDNLWKLIGGIFDLIRGIIFG